MLSNWGNKRGLDSLALVGIEDGVKREGSYRYKYGFINKSGEVVVGKTKTNSAGKYDGADSFSEGLAPVKIGKKWDMLITKIR